MAKLEKLSSQWDVKNNVLSLTIEARPLDASKDAKPTGSFTRSLDLEAAVPGFSALNELGQEAMSFGIFTALRNTTGSCSDLAEAEAAVDARLEPFQNGEYGAVRESSAVPFTASHLLCKAVELASGGKQTSEQAAELLNGMVTAGLAANGIASFTALEPSERNKARKQVIDQISKAKPRIAAAFAKLEAAKALEAQQRKAAQAEKALAADGDDSGNML